MADVRKEGADKSTYENSMMIILALQIRQVCRCLSQYEDFG